MHLINLSKEERKQYYKLLTVDDFKRVVKYKERNTVVLRVFTKSADRVSKQEIVSYLEENYHNEDDDFVKLYDTLTCSKIQAEFKHLKEIADCLKDKKYDSLNDEDRENVNKYASAWANKGYKLPFEAFIKACCEPDEAALNSINSIKTNNDLLDAEKKVEELTQKVTDLENKLNKYIEDNKKLKKENAELTEENQDYNAILNKDVISVKLGDLLGMDFSAKSVNEVYELLNDLEEKTVNEMNYEKIDLILACKYEVNQLLKGGNR